MLQNEISHRVVHEESHLQGNEVAHINARMETVGARVKAARDKAGMSQARLAAAVGVDQGTISNIERNITANSPHLVRIAAALGVDALWLSSGKGDMEPVGARRANASFEAAAEAAPEHSLLQASEDTLEIRVLDQAASMGYGAQRQDFVDTIDVVRINKLWLRQNLTFTNFDNLALITGLGDSMESTFSDGDVLLVDRGVNDLKLDAVYVLGLGDEVYIKRIQRRPDGTFLMISDNPKYPPYPINEADNFQVLARVLLAWNARRL